MQPRDPDEVFEGPHERGGHIRVEMLAAALIDDRAGLLQQHVVLADPLGDQCVEHCHYSSAQPMAEQNIAGAHCTVRQC